MGMSMPEVFGACQWSQFAVFINQKYANVRIVEEYFGLRTVWGEEQNLYKPKGP